MLGKTKNQIALRAMGLFAVALLLNACAAPTASPISVPPTNTPLLTAFDTPTSIPMTATLSPTGRNTPALVPQTPTLMPTIKPGPNATPKSLVEQTARGAQLASVIKYLDMFDPANSTPGTQFALKELTRVPEQDKTKIEVDYEMTVSGLPQDKPFQLWVMSIAREKPVLLGTSTIPSHGSLGVYPAKGFSRGEPLLLDLISEDKKISVFGKAIPFPIEAVSPAGCRMSVELGSALGDMFVIKGEGFIPNEEITIVDTSVTEVMNLKKKADANGNYTVTEFPAVVGYESGSASYAIAGKTCQVTVNYDWGPAAIHQ